MLSQLQKEDTAMPDGCANTHIADRNWLPLTPLTGSLVKRANMTGFDDEHARMTGLPIGTGVTKCHDNEGNWVMLRATTAIFNSKSNLTLLSNYQMREAGLIVDDITKRHLKDLTSHGTHCMHDPNSGHTIPFITKSGLPAFRVHKPTMNEH